MSSWKGGAIRVAFDSMRVLGRRGHKVTMYTIDLSEENKDLDVLSIANIRRFRTLAQGMAKKIKFYITPEIISQARKEIQSFDIVHLHGYRGFQGVVVCHYAKKCGVPYVLQAHGSLPRIMTKRTLKWVYDVLFGYGLLRDASKVIALSQMEAEQYRVMGVPEEKIAIIPNGIDLLEYANLPPKGSFKVKYGISEDKKIILYLARIHKIKGIDFLIKAYAKLVKEMNAKNALLAIAGPDDGYLSTVKYLFTQLKIQDKVLLSGPLYGESKLEAYVDAEVYILPSRYETFPMSLLEAYACGRPVITSKLDGLKDLVIDGVTGLLVEPGNTEELAKSILSLLNDNKKAEEVGSRGKLFVKENFSTEKVVDKLEQLYEEVITSYRFTN